MALCVNEALWEPEDTSDKHEFWIGRTLNLKHLHKLGYLEEVRLILEIGDRIKASIETNYNVDHAVLDLLQLCRWPEGIEQTPHHDDMIDTNPGKDMSWFEHRQYACIIYLNDDYEGGQTYYPNYDIYVTPKTNRAAIHRGNADHEHGVTKVTKLGPSGMRYTIASFWGTDPKYYEEYNHLR